MSKCVAGKHNNGSKRTTVAEMFFFGRSPKIILNSGGTKHWWFHTAEKILLDRRIWGNATLGSSGNGVFEWCNGNENILWCGKRRYEHEGTKKICFENDLWTVRLPRPTAKVLKLSCQTINKCAMLIVIHFILISNENCMKNFDDNDFVVTSQKFWVG